ncbi:AzlC family ABC transporter permease [Haloarculaceae archaeon H-GB11]|nr:AzlC family ABC transporter permease [Haloarculaceae archaeon H-GB11]
MVVLTAIVINLRMMMYSASIAPYFRRLAAPTKWIAAYLLTDQAYAVSIAEFRQTTPGERSRKWFYFGAAVTLWVPWQIVTVVGALVGASVPEGLSLEFAIPLTFMALLVPTLDGRSTEIAALVGGGVAVVAAVFPFNLGLITAALLGVASGVGHEVLVGEFPTTDASAHGDGGDSA